MTTGSSDGDSLRDFFDVIDEGFCLCEMLVNDLGEPYDYRFLETNPLFEEMSGLSRAVGRTVKELVPHLEDHWIQTYARAALDGQRVRFDQGSEATGRWFEVFAAPLGKPRQFAIVFKDVTTTRQARVELERSEERFRSLTNQLPLIVWVHDADGAQEFVNTTFLEYFGVTEEQLQNDEWEMLTDPAHGPAYIERFVEAVRTQSDFHGEVRAQRADGEWRWVESWGAPRFDDDGTFLGHVGTSVDIEDRKRAEAQLKKSAAFTERVLDGLFSFAGVLELGGTVIFVNRAPLEAAGLALEDVVDKKFWDCFWWSYDAQVCEQLRSAAATAAAGTYVRYDVEIRIAGDVLLPIDFQIAPLADDAGTISHLVVSGLDLTERRRAEARIAATLESERAALERAVTLERVAVGLAEAATVSDVGRAAIDALSPIGLQALSVTIERNGRLEAVAVTGLLSGEQLSGLDSASIDEEIPVAEVFRTGVPMRFDDPAAFDARYPDLVELRTVAGFASTHFIPIVGSDANIFGVLATASADVDWYTDERCSLLDAVALQMRGALERATLHEDARKAQARADLVASLLTELEEQRTVDDQQQRLVELLVPHLADYATIEAPTSSDPLRALHHADHGKAVTLATLRRHHRLEVANAHSVASAEQDGGRLVVSVSPKDHGELGVDSNTERLLEDLGSLSHVVVPMPLGDDETGVLMCGLSDPERRPYSKDDLAFIKDIAKRASAIIRATHAREQEHRSSLRLQQALLPDYVVEHHNLDVAARYQAGSDRLDVGGDWYDTFTWPGGEYGIVVGDVVGHGIEAAAAMGRLRARCEPLISMVAPDPVAVLEVIEAQAIQQGTIPFLTACCLVIEPTGRVVVANAGHPPPLVAHRVGGSTWLDGARGPAICGLDSPQRQPFAFELQPDDVIIAFSDGLVERRGQTLDDGLGWLRGAAEILVHDDVERITSALVATMAESGEDDVIVVAARHAPSRPRFFDRIPSDMGVLAPLRNRFHQWLNDEGTTHDQIETILLAVGEACSNAIEHSFAPGRRGSIQVRAAVDHAGEALVVTVIDNGIWRTPSLFPPHRGRGTSIMEAVSDRFERVSGPAGTTTTLHFVRRA